MKKIKNFSRFFALLKNIQGDPEELKENLVRAFTSGRTVSLREMAPGEYNRMCDSLQSAQSPSLSQKEFTGEIKKKRSAVLKRMQQLGIDTLDWAAVDEFCLNPRIAGKVFRQLSLDDLKRLIPKLAAIAAKPRPEDSVPAIADLWPYERVVEFTRNQIPN